MRIKPCVLGLAVLMVAPVCGQTVHKCPGPDGKPIYQQASCAGDAGDTLSIETGKASKTRKATDEEAAECLKLIKIVTSFKDPESLKIEGGAYINEYPSGRKEIMFSLNGKNSYGAYAGAKPAYCKYKANGSVEDLKAF